MLATYVVSNLNDAPVAAAGDAPGTLRQAIYDANHSTHSDDPDVIQFSAGLTGNINLSIADDLTFGPTALVINSSMRIEGNGHALTIKRDSSVANLRLFLVAPGVDFTIDSLMLYGGVAQGAAGASGQNGVLSYDCVAENYFPALLGLFSGSEITNRTNPAAPPSIHRFGAVL